jgi:hypothetical protein
MSWLVDTLRMSQKFQRAIVILLSNISGDWLNQMRSHEVAPQKNNVRPCVKPLVSRITTEITPPSSAISVGHKSDVLATNDSVAPRYAEVWILFKWAILVRLIAI